MDIVWFLLGGVVAVALIVIWLYRKHRASEGVWLQGKLDELTKVGDKVSDTVDGLRDRINKNDN